MFTQQLWAKILLLMIFLEGCFLVTAPIQGEESRATCSPSYLAYYQDPNVRYEHVSPEVLHAWKYYRSYYALREIIETYGMVWRHTTSQDEIRTYLGEPVLGYEEIVGSEDNVVIEESSRIGNEQIFPQNAWFYPSRRKSSQKSTLMLRFNEQGQIRAIGWVKQPLRPLRIQGEEGESPLLACSPYLKLLHDPKRWETTVSDEVLHAWTQYRSYYALIEILDTYLNPENITEATKEEVREYLGEPGRYFVDPNFGEPAFEGNSWMYSSRRRVPIGSYLLIGFDDDGTTNPEKIYWVSE
jgi:hypothetical protein